eukprot:TRINITY_DN2035_c3_g1_i1.p1 TRINITY_DN2035_c3_g1~~TRINITY_DN2035_c3_g1_i1.p1  ORF type:complete len:1414 (+),score=265.29 TRINITY_DN2035_c3_g1_i1:110-4351(+)
MKAIAMCLGLGLMVAGSPSPAPSLNEEETLTDRCMSGLRVKRKDTLWCATSDSPNVYIVESKKECEEMHSDSLYCSDIPCQIPDACQQAYNKLAIEFEPLSELDSTRICGCLGEPFGLRNDQWGFKQCVHRETYESPWLNAFDTDINTYNYTHVSCEQLERCSPLRWYDQTKWWDKIKKLSECDSYTECRILQNVARATECGKPTLKIRDTNGAVCNAATKKEMCDNQMEAMLCIGDLGCEGAIADTPDDDPPKDVCAGMNSCSSTRTKTSCLQMGNVWCPDLSGNRYSPQPVVDIARRSELCNKCEVDTPSKICCIDNNDIITPVDSAVDCTATNDTLCIDVDCDLHASCIVDFGEKQQHYLNESLILVQEVCDCLGDEFIFYEDRGRAYCLHGTEYGMWNSKETANNSVRSYHYLTCDQLARCEPPSALNDVLWLRSLPNSCDELITCSKHKEAQEANMCKTLTIYDRDGAECSAVSKNHFCEAESRAYMCADCPEGLTESSATCWAAGQCTTGETSVDCLAKGGYYCPDIYKSLNITLPNHESCLVCENANPSGLCCTRNGKAFAISNPADCYGEGAVLCGDVECTTTQDDCKISTTSDHLLHEMDVCKCLGDGYSVFPDASGVPYCYQISPFKIWYASTRDTATSQKFNVTCDQLYKCWDEAALNKAEMINSFPLHCSTVTTCRKRRAEERMQASKMMEFRGSTSTCTTEQRDHIATAESYALKCINCQVEESCIAPGSEAIDYCTNATEAQCEADGNFACSHIFHAHKSDSEVCAACPGSSSPDKAICAGDHGECTGNSTEATCVGVFCPSLTRSAACVECEKTESGICCLQSNSLTASVVANANECSASGGELCVNVRCNVDPDCSADYAVEFEKYRDQNKKDTTELCQCLGPEFTVVESSNRIYYCVHAVQFRKWNSYEITDDPTTRMYSYATCEQLARCEPPSALDDVFYYKTVPASCGSTIDCARGREGQEALLCKQSTFIDKKGNQCTVDQQNHFCEAEIRAHKCAQCQNGLDASAKVCVNSRGSCFEGQERDACVGYYCPDIYAELQDLGIPAHESCSVCESQYPDSLCCTRNGTSFPIVSREECYGNGSVLCSDVSCVTESTPSECSVASGPSAELHLKHQESVCKCLGLGHSVIYDQFTGIPNCYDDTTLKPWDDYNERELGNRTYSVSCEQLVECETAAALDEAALTMSFTNPACDPLVKCKIRRAREKELATKMVNIFGGSKQCSEAQRDNYASLETNAIKCVTCPGAQNASSTTCVARIATTPSQYCGEAPTEADCGSQGYYCASLYRENLDSLTLCKACPGGLDPLTNTCATPEGMCISGSSEETCSGVFCRAIFGAAVDENGLGHVVVGDPPSQNIGPFVMLAFAIIIVLALIFLIMSKRKAIEKDEALVQNHNQ